MRAVPWEIVFGNHRPVEIEIGPGRGDVLLAFAAAAPLRNFFAIERGAEAAAAIEARTAGQALTNVRVVAGDARCILGTCVPDASVAAYHVYFPDPWPKRRHHRRRLATPEFAATLARTLAPGGSVHVASDLPEVVAGLALRLRGAGLRPAAGPPPPRPATVFERRYGAAGTHYGRFCRPA
jgi:tRNA (guanine-N7-)-methyltransferase